MTIAEKLVAVAENVPKVYNAGYEKGKAEGGGGDGWYDTFWDAYQADVYGNAGKRTDYRYAFSRIGWNSTAFMPKHNLTVGLSDYMFWNSNIEIDLVERMELLGITLDFSQCTSFDFTFSGNMTRIGIVDMRKSKGSLSVFRNATKLHTIDKVIVSETYPIDASSFYSCSKLKNITIEGFITGNFNIAYSPLSVDSMKSIITHLKDYTGTTNEFKRTVSFSASCWEILDAEGATSPNNNTWREYINDLCWNVG